MNRRGNFLKNAKMNLTFIFLVLPIVLAICLTLFFVQKHEKENKAF